jgi:hypothetical protein
MVKRFNDTGEVVILFEQYTDKWREVRGEYFDIVASK